MTEFRGSPKSRACIASTTACQKRFCAINPGLRSASRASKPPREAFEYGAIPRIRHRTSDASRRFSTTTVVLLSFASFFAIFAAFSIAFSIEGAFDEASGVPGRPEGTTRHDSMSPSVTPSTTRSVCVIFFEQPPRASDASDAANARTEPLTTFPRAPVFSANAASYGANRTFAIRFVSRHTMTKSPTNLAMGVPLTKRSKRNAGNVSISYVSGSRVGFGTRRR